MPDSVIPHSVIPDSMIYPIPLYQVAPSYSVQGTAKRRFPGLVNFIAAVAYHFCLALPAAFTQPWDHLLVEPCTDLQESQYDVDAIGVLPLNILSLSLHFPLVHRGLVHAVLHALGGERERDVVPALPLLLQPRRHLRIPQHPRRRGWRGS